MKIRVYQSKKEGIRVIMSKQDLNDNKTSSLKYNIDHQKILLIKGSLEAGETLRSVASKFNVGINLVSKIKNDNSLLSGQSALAIGNIKKDIIIQASTGVKKLLKAITDRSPEQLAIIPVDKLSYTAKNLHEIYRLETGQSTQNINSISEIINKANARAKKSNKDNVDDAVYTEIKLSDSDK